MKKTVPKNILVRLILTDVIREINPNNEDGYDWIFDSLKFKIENIQKNDLNPNDVDDHVNTLVAFLRKQMLWKKK